jgi:hypothetical protein
VYRARTAGHKHSAGGSAGRDFLFILLRENIVSGLSAERFIEVGISSIGYRNAVYASENGDYALILSIIKDIWHRAI